MSDAAARAAHAKRLMDDPMLVEALANVRSDAIRRWESTAEHDVQGREFAWMSLKNLCRIEAELKNIIIDGEMAARRVHAPVR